MDPYIGRLTWVLFDTVLSMIQTRGIDAQDAFVQDQRSMRRLDEAQEARVRKLTSIGSREVFPTGFVILQQPGSSHRIRFDVIVVDTKDDLVILNADVRRDPDGEIGRIHKADVTGVRMLDEAGNPISMMQPRDVVELDEPEHSYVVAVDRRDGDATVSQAFVFRSLSVADEARRDFERNLARPAPSE